MWQPVVLAITCLLIHQTAGKGQNFRQSTYYFWAKARLQPLCVALTFRLIRRHCNPQDNQQAFITDVKQAFKASNVS